MANSWTLKVLLLAVILGGSPACDPDDPKDSSTVVHQGSAPSTGGNVQTGGEAGAEIGEGGAETGGGDPTGGNVQTGGEAGSEADPTGGDSSTGGTCIVNCAETGGSDPTGGNVQTGGNVETGGDTGTGGEAGAENGEGGNEEDPTGGEAGAENGEGGAETGGSDPTGGTAGTGGDIGTGGTATECRPLYAGCQVDEDCCTYFGEVPLFCNSAYGDTCSPPPGYCAELGKHCDGDAVACCDGLDCVDGQCESRFGTGGTSGTGGTAGTGGDTGTGGTVTECEPGLDPATEPAEPFSCRSPVRDTDFDQIVVEYNLQIMNDAWRSSDGVEYAVAGPYDGFFLFQNSGSGWSKVEDLPADFRPSLVREIEGRVCVGGSRPNPTNLVFNAVLLCKQGDAWVEQDVGFCPTGCLNGGFFDTEIIGISSADGISVIISGGFLDVFPSVTSHQIFVKKEQGDWERQTLPVTDDLWLYGVWAHSACDAYAVGSYDEHGIVLHYNGSTWSVLNAPEGEFDAFLSVHGNGSEIYLGGVFELEGYPQGRGVFSSDLTTWQRVSTGGVSTGALWTPSLGSAIFGQDGGPFGQTALEIRSEGEFEDLPLLDDEFYVRSLFGDEDGIIMGMDGDEGSGSRASIYRMTCE